MESNKDHKDIASLLRLGKTLTIDKDTFEDLDEVNWIILVFFAFGGAISFEKLHARNLLPVAYVSLVVKLQ